jgi:hypothetical protein
MTDANASSPAPPDLDAEAKALKLEQVKAEARKAIAEANAGALNAGLYQAKSEPIKGETTFDEKADSLLSIIALRALDRLTGEISAAVQEAISTGSAILIVDDRALGLTDAAHDEIAARFDWFVEQFQAILAQLQAPAVSTAATHEPEVAFLAPVLAALPAAQAALSAVGLAADLVGMFKTNYSVQGRAVKFGYTALAAGVADRLSRSSIAVVIDGFQTLEHSSTLQTFRDLLTLRSQVEESALRCDAVELTGPSARIEALSKRIGAAGAARDSAAEAGQADAAQRGDQVIASLEEQLAAEQTPAFLTRKAQITAAKTLVAAFDQYIAATSAIASGDTYSPLIAAALRDSLHDGVPTTGGGRVEIDHVLYLAIAASGGDVTTQSGLFKNNDNVRLVAAVQATYLLADRAGLIKAGGSRGASAAAKVKLSDNKIEWYDTPSQ